MQILIAKFAVVPDDEKEIFRPASRLGQLSGLLGVLRFGKEMEKQSSAEKVNKLHQFVYHRI